MKKIYQLFPTPENPKIYELRDENGIPKHCPFKMPLVRPGRTQGSMAIEYHRCISSCAMFRNFNNDDDIVTVALDCSHYRTIIEAEIIPEKTPPPIKLVN